MYNYFTYHTYRVCKQGGLSAVGVFRHLWLLISICFPILGRRITLKLNHNCVLGSLCHFWDTLGTLWDKMSATSCKIKMFGPFSGHTLEPKWCWEVQKATKLKKQFLFLLFLDTFRDDDERFLVPLRLMRAPVRGIPQAIVMRTYGIAAVYCVQLFYIPYL